MGIGPEHLDLYMHWHDQGWLNAGDAVLDFGAQELFCGRSPSHINRFVSSFGGEPFPDCEAKRLAENGMAGEMMVRAGFRYASVDYKDYPFAVRLNLNLDELPREHHGKYRLVTNHGTSEHILNQWNVFKAMHDAAAQGGLIYHAVPCCGEFDHGIFNYNAKFWWALSDANGYRTLKMSAWIDDKAKQVPDSFSDTITDYLPSAWRAPSGWMNILFQKTEARPFAGLVDPAFR
jgi:hypothetical protein